MPDQPKIDACGFFNPREQIPGYDDAQASTDEMRNDAMLGLPEEICGLTVLPLTPRHLNWLDIYASPFLYRISPEDLLQRPDIALHIARFLWVVSPQFSPFSSWRRKFFFLKYRRTLYGCKTMVDDAVKSIFKYIDEAFQDLKSGSGSVERKSYYSTAALLTHLLCERYGGLSPDPNAPNAAMDVPLKVSSQLFRAHRRINDPKAPLDNPTDQMERDWLIEYNKSLKRN